VEISILVMGGLVAGALGGMLGLGGGILLMPLLRFWLGLPPAEAAGTCVVIVFFTTLGGTYRHARLGNIRITPILPVIACGALTSVAASLAFVSLAAHGRGIDLGIGTVFVLIAARMLAEGARGPRDEAAQGTEIHGPLAAKLGIGAAAGALPGLLGIGTGGILVPAFTFLLRAPVRTAIGASLVCFCVNALISAGFKLAQGYVDLGIALPACAGTLVGANLGALLNRKVSSRGLRLIFALVFASIAAKFVLAGFLSGV
jgi:uncharacterized protein